MRYRLCWATLADLRPPRAQLGTILGQVVRNLCQLGLTLGNLGQLGAKLSQPVANLSQLGADQRPHRTQAGRGCQKSCRILIQIHDRHGAAMDRPWGRFRADQRPHGANPTPYGANLRPTRGHTGRGCSKSCRILIQNDDRPWTHQHRRSFSFKVTVGPRCLPLRPHIGPM